jgi:hypothetical protein
MRKTNHSYKSNKTNQKKEKNNFYYESAPLDEEMKNSEDSLFEEEPVITPIELNKRNHSEENLSAMDDLEKQSYTDDWYEGTKEKKKQ